MRPIQRITAAVVRALTNAQQDGEHRPLLVAVSGGPDSTALALGVGRLRAEGLLGPRAIWLAHVDHGRHAGDREAPARTAALARALGLEHVSRPIEPSPAAGEAELRDLRYAALAEIARDRSAAAMLTAHHADDDIETVLLRAMRGTGARGLAGVPRSRPWIPGCVLLRPLLALPRSELCRAAESAPIPAFDDPTNRDLRRSRNALRHRLLPAWRPRFPAACEARILTLARAARRRADRNEGRATTWLATCATHGTGSTLEMPFPPESLAGEVLRLAHRALAGADPSRIWIDRTLRLRRTGARAQGGSPVVATRTRHGLLLETDRGEPAAPRTPHR